MAIIPGVIGAKQLYVSEPRGKYDPEDSDFTNLYRISTLTLASRSILMYCLHSCLNSSCRFKQINKKASRNVMSASGFTRQETIALTGISSGRLSYLDRTQLVVPSKFGNPKHPKVVYSWKQVLGIKTIERLREKIPLQEIRKVLRFLKEHNYEPSFFAHNLVLLNSQLYLIKDLREFGLAVLEVSGDSKGQVVIHEVGPIGDIMAELAKEAEKHHVLDFEKRAGISSLASYV